MNNSELCPTCRPLGKCQFEKAAKSVAGNVPPLKLQTPIESGGKRTIEALDAHEMIALFRETARKQNCPKINSVKPAYPGKNNL